jgi:DnaD/phage-associated family protein
MGDRALTSKERECIGQWFGAFGYDIKMVERAYELTVNSAKKVSVGYTHKILERWSNEGIRTLDDVQRSIDERKAEKTQETQGSFDTDDFFEAALKRSYQDK